MRTGLEGIADELFERMKRGEALTLEELTRLANSPDMRFDEQQKAEAIAALQSLEPKRAAAVALYLRGASAVDVGERLGMSKDDATREIARGLARIRLSVSKPGF